MKLNKILNKFGAAALSAVIAVSVTVSASAWGENPAESDAAETTVAETSAPAEDTTTVPEAVLDDEPVDTEDTESPDEEDILPEDTEATETEAPEDTEPLETEATTTTTTAAPVTTPAATYDEVSPFEMYVPDTLNIRTGPGTNYDKLGMAYPTTIVTVIGKSGDWYVIDYYGAPGFLLASNLTEVPTTTTTTSAPPVETPESEDEAVTEAPVDTDDGAVLDTEPVETETTTKPNPAETTPSETEEDNQENTPAAPVTDKNDEGGLPPIILALICGVATFILIGVIPVLIHKAHHKKLYQY